MKNIQRLFFVLAFLSWLSGCAPMSVNPLSDPAAAEIDQRLIGVWYPQDPEDGHGYVHFVKSQDKGWLDVVIIDYKKSGGVGIETFQMFTTKLGQHYFMNMIEMPSKEKEKKNEDEKYNLIFYKFLDGSLLFRFMSDKLVAQSIERGELKGTVNRGKWGTDVTITDATENLARYILQSDISKLFPQDSSDKPIILKKIIHQHP